MYVSMYVCVYVGTLYGGMSVCVHGRTYVCMYVCMHVYVRITLNSYKQPFIGAARSKPPGPEGSCSAVALAHASTAAAAQPVSGPGPPELELPR